MEHGVVGGGAMAIAGLEGSPAEDVKSKFRIRLVTEGNIDVGGGEARPKAGDPSLKFLLKGSGRTGPEVRVRVRDGVRSSG